MMDDFDEGWIYRSKNSEQWMKLTDDAAELGASVANDIYQGVSRLSLREFSMDPSKLNPFHARYFEHNLIPLRTALRQTMNDEELQIVIILYRVLSSPFKYYEVIFDLVSTIFDSIIAISSNEKIEVILQALVENGLIDDVTIAQQLKNYFRDKFSFSMSGFIHSVTNINPYLNYESPQNVLERFAAKILVKDALVYTLSNLIAIIILNNLSKAAVIRGSIGLPTLAISGYGMIEKMSISSRKLYRTHPVIYSKLREKNINMLYYFAEPLLSKILTLVSSSDSKLVLDNLYLSFDELIKNAMVAGK
ncbi:hypothetical protein AB7Z98_06960 [Providencia manganoxydans]|uniref:hypothetical protein n=1 Tax=Providencia manganoxydans TaxID=2923283 RepID=UPI0034E48FB2